MHASADLRFEEIESMSAPDSDWYIATKLGIAVGLGLGAIVLT
ncbi:MULTISPECIES: daptide-type RiPP [unclassified Rathayibacter]|nr:MULTISPECIES: daptide-type RiPP [unclassified Rathayibacter]